MPDEGPIVIIRFYENLRIETVDVSRVLSKLEGGLQEDPESGDIFLDARIKLIATAGTWKITFKFSSLREGETEPISAGASALDVEEALEATGIGEWDVSVVEGEFLVRMWARGVSFGVSPGMAGVSIDLSGVTEEKGFYDEVKYERRLIFGCANAPLPKAQVNSEGDNSSAKPSDRPITGHHA